MSRRLALLAHGSRSPAWAEGFAPLVAAVEAVHGPGAVSLCFLEGFDPDLVAIAAEAARDGVEELRILPLFWSGGGHVMRDVPAMVERAAAAAAEAAQVAGRPAPVLTLLPTVGEQPGVHAAVAALVAAGLQSLGSADMAEPGCR